jgi:hypothetical protein
MKALTVALLWLCCAATALAEDADVCEQVRGLVQAESPLPRVAAAIEKQQLDIAVIGSASSTLPGPGGTRAAYPAHLEAALAERLPGVTVKVVSLAKPRQSAVEQTEQLERVVSETRPALVIWQTGTVDAMRGIDVDEFRAALEAGIDTLHAGGADVILMNMQYSPRTESMIAVGAYADNMHWVALQREVPLFDRLAMMKQWSELGTFDLYSATKKLDLAARVHDCIGRLLADLVLAAVQAVDTKSESDKPESDKPGSEQTR